MGSGKFRNMPCPCKSKAKFKHCHGSKGARYEDVEKGFLLKKLYKESKHSKCFFEDWGGCDKISSAHTIQNNRILKNISEKGLVQVVGFDPENFNEEGPGLTFVSQGRSSATTFTGMCNKHDSSIFRPIDTTQYTAGNLDQELLFALRALLLEIYKKEGSILMLKAAAQSDKTKDLTSIALAIQGNENAVQYGNEYLVGFKSALKEKKYECISSISVSLPGEHLLAVSTCFGLEYDLEGNKVQDISVLSARIKLVFMTVFPQDGVTKIIFSWLSEDEPTFESFKKEILSLNHDGIKNGVSNIILNYCENVVFGPKLWDHYSVDEKKRFEKEFYGRTNSLRGPRDLLEAPALQLFQLT